jgi:probable phosphoglycerate mutase
MLTLHLIRHGETEASGDGVFCGDLDPPLTGKGKEQAEALTARTARLALSAIYVSPKLRARQTAEPTCRATRLDPHIEDGLREIGYGAWEGRKEIEIRESDPATYAAWVSDPAIHSPPGGENGYAIAARSLPVLERIRVANPNGNVLIVSHKATIRVLVCALLGLHVGRFRDRIACPTASLTTFEFGDRGPMLVRIGER